MFNSIIQAIVSFFNGITNFCNAFANLGTLAEVATDDMVTDQRIEHAMRVNAMLDKAREQGLDVNVVGAAIQDNTTQTTND